MKFLILAALLIASPVIAQERTAGGSMATEASWTALQSRIAKTDSDVSVIKVDLNAMKACAAQKKLWLPGTGCVGPDMSLYDKMLDCGTSGMVYNKNTNSCVSTGSLRWRFREQITASSSGYFSQFFSTYAGPPSSVPGYGSRCASNALVMDTCSSAGQVCFSTRNGNYSCSGSGSGTGCNAKGNGFVEIYQCSQ